MDQEYVRRGAVAFAANRRQIVGVRPEHGGRLELKLTRAAGESARYTLDIFTPDAEVSTTVVVDAPSNALQFGEWLGGRPPAWLEALARTLLRTAVRSKTSDGQWPRRVTRWRPAPPPS